MLKIKAKEDSTIEVIEGKFPLGQRNTIKVYFDDEIVKKYINLIGTNTCLAENNLFPYGNFDYKSDINNISLNLNENSEVSIVSGYGYDYSRCLKCSTTNSEQGLGSCELKPKDKLINGKEYIISCYIATIDDTLVYFNIDDNLVPLKYSDNNLHFFTYKFTATKEDFKLKINMTTTGTCYIDSLQMFLAENEIKENKCDILDFEVKILNPIQYKEINELITYGSDIDGTYIILYMPEINLVDFQDNLLCNFNVSVAFQQRNIYLGDSEYNKIKEYIYNSDKFILSGYILPVKSEGGCDCEGYELTVGAI